MVFTHARANLAGLFRDLLPCTSTSRDLCNAGRLGAHLEAILPRRWGLLLEDAVLRGVRAGHLPRNEVIARLNALSRAAYPLRYNRSADAVVGACLGILLDHPIEHLIEAGDSLNQTGDRPGSDRCWVRALAACKIADVSHGGL